MKTWRERNQRMKLIRYALMAVLVFVMWQYSRHGSEDSAQNSSGISVSNNGGVSLSLRKLNQKEPYFFRASEAQEEDDVVILTQLTLDRIDSLIAMSKAWDGPISAAVLIRSDEELNSLATKIQQVETLSRHVDFHLWSQPHPGPYPVNHLRNFATINSRCKYILTLDVDFVPSIDSHQILREFRERLDKNPLTALVVAAFELAKGVTEIPEKAEEVREMMDSGEIWQVHFSKSKRAHAPTNYPRWRSIADGKQQEDSKVKDATTQEEDTEEGKESGGKWYSTNYEYLWEPYVMLRRDEAPEYDERFIGYGNDKVSFAYELAAKGFRFEVLRDTFIVHRDHGVPSWRVDQGSSRAWRRWADFVRDVRRKYNGFQLEVPDWLKQDCLRGDCPVFWNWF